MSKRQRGSRSRPVRRTGRAVRSPSRHPRDWFETIVDRVEHTLPASLAPALEEVRYVVEDWPTDDDLRDQGLDEDYGLYGMYDGATRFEDTDRPRKVIIFRGPLEEDFPDPVDLEREIRFTMEHELAHYFGAEDHYHDGRDDDDGRPKGLRARLWDWLIHP